MYLPLFSKLFTLPAESGKQIWIGREQQEGMKLDFTGSFFHKNNFSASKTMFYKLRLTLQSPENHQGDAKCQDWLRANEPLQHCAREQNRATSAACEPGKPHTAARYVHQ